MIDVLGPEKRRRRTTQEKIAIVQQSFEPGMTVSLVARQHGVAASQLFLWRKQYREGSLTAVAAGEQVVPASELAAAMKQIKELQRLLGKKTMENELLKEAVEYGRAKVDRARALIARGWGVSLVSRCLRVSRAQLHVILRRTDDWMDGRRSRHTDDTDVLLRIHHVIGELPTYGYRRYGRCFADRQNLMVCLRSMPNVFTGSCARMRCCLSENLLYRHRNGHIQAEWP